MKKNQITSVFLILVFLFSVSTKQVHAKWGDRSDELPGASGGGDNTALAVAAGVSVGLLVYYLIKKNNKKSVAVNMVEYRSTKQSLLWENNLDTKNRNSTKASLATNYKGQKLNSSLVIDTQGNLLQQVEDASKTIPINLLVAPLNTKDRYAMKNINGIQVGLRIKF